MSDKLISADRLKLALERIFGPSHSAAVLEQLIDIVPAVDAVEVVRCGKCKYYSRSEYTDRGYCDFDDGLCGTVKNDSFCSYGERREDNADD